MNVTGRSNDAKLKQIDVPSMAKMVANQCNNESKPSAIFFSAKYSRRSKQTGKYERRGHANIIFLESNTMVRYDPMALHLTVQ